MEVYRRRTEILTLLDKQGQVSVDDLALHLDVSENTIRNDLNALESENLLQRVRGGAVNQVNSYKPLNKEFARRFQTNQEAKQQIGRWAANLISDGDAIILDASSTVYHLATFLQEHNNLTVVTNGLETASLLAHNPTNKVILAANTVRSNGLTVTGNLQPDLLNYFFASKCFITSSGISAKQGLTAADADEAPLITQMIKLARKVIALVDCSKIDKVETYRFADLNQIDHLITNEPVTIDALSELRQATNFPITVVGSSSAETFEHDIPGRKHSGYRIGFGNMTETMLFAQQVRRSLERSIKAHDDMELLIRDNKLDRRVALENADWFVAQEVDLVIEYQIDAQAGNVIMDRFKQANIPVISVDIPLPGATFFGADNYRAGCIAGEALGHWIRANWQGQLDVLLRLESHRTGPVVGARLQGQQEGLESILGPLAKDQVISIDIPFIVEIAGSAVLDLLKTLPLESYVAIVAINDDAALGVLAAFEEAGRLHQVVAVGQNADRLGRTAMRRPGFPFIGSTRYAAEEYGPKILELALKILKGEAVPPAVYNQHVFITKDNVDQYYPAGS